MLDSIRVAQVVNPIFKILFC